MKVYGKRIASLVMALLFCTAAVFGNAQSARAAEKNQFLLYETGTAAANTEVSHNFTVSDVNEMVIFDLILSAPANCTISIRDSAGNQYDGGDVSSESFYAQEYNGAYVYVYEFYEKKMPAGDYTFRFTPAENVNYIMAVEPVTPQPTLSQTKATVTVGMKCILKVDNTDEKITWKSSKKSVATVSSKGVVTGKKAGTATITATTKSGVKLTCKVTVKANKYTETKVTLKDVPYGNNSLQVYSASYASNGDLVLKCRFVNNEGYKVTSLEDVKIKFMTAEGKHIGTYSAKYKAMSVSDESIKDFSLTIKKADLKIKKADLRNATYELKGQCKGHY